MKISFFLLLSWFCFQIPSVEASQGLRRSKGLTAQTLNHDAIIRFRESHTLSEGSHVPTSTPIPVEKYSTNRIFVAQVPALIDANHSGWETQLKAVKAEALILKGHETTTAKVVQNALEGTPVRHVFLVRDGGSTVPFAEAYAKEINKRLALIPGDEVRHVTFYGYDPDYQRKVLVALDTAIGREPSQKKVAQILAENPATFGYGPNVPNKRTLSVDEVWKLIGEGERLRETKKQMNEGTVLSVKEGLTSRNQFLVLPRPFNQLF